jgi:hypothetical protein
MLLSGLLEADRSSPKKLSKPKNKIPHKIDPEITVA